MNASLSVKQAMEGKENLKAQADAKMTSDTKVIIIQISHDK